MAYYSFLCARHFGPRQLLSLQGEVDLRPSTPVHSQYPFTVLLDMCKNLLIIWKHLVPAPCTPSPRHLHKDKIGPSEVPCMTCAPNDQDRAAAQRENSHFKSARANIAFVRAMTSKACPAGFRMCIDVSRHFAVAV